MENRKLHHPYTVYARNVNEALFHGMHILKSFGVRTESRGIEVIECPAPVITHYTRPRERVLFDPLRDANPFFHFFEALWILAGRQDVEFLAYFNGNIKNYSDDRLIFHAPYGHRLRNMYGHDQVDELIQHLQKKPDSRQGVLQIWNHQWDLDADTKDIPCNDMVFLKVRDNHLDMTVCCRSNDIIWGAYGANVVQFSMLQEYIAARLDLNVGSYYQMSDSYHVYPTVPYWQQFNFQTFYPDIDPYRAGTVEPYPLFTDPELIDDELFEMFIAWDSHKDLYRTGRANTELVSTNALPMFAAWQAYKEDDLLDAQHAAHYITATDWRMACVEWLQRRIDKRKSDATSS